MADKQELTDSSHLNPSRRKIPTPICRRGFTFGHCKNEHKNSDCRSQTGFLSQIVHNPQNSLDSLLQESSLQEHQQLLEQNRYLKKQLDDMKQTNKSLLNRLEEKQNMLVHNDSEYRELVLKVNNQLERTSTQIKSFVMDECKSILKSKQLNLEDSLVDSKSREKCDCLTVSRRSKDQLLRLKQSFEDMDFNVVEKLARSKSSKRRRYRRNHQ